jgi:RimJ/RimL family protein N-acetyltransferase
MSSTFDLFSPDYRFGNCFVRPYDRKQTDIFPDEFLLQLYWAARPRIYSTFCGMQDLSAPAICGYLATRNPLLLMCIDDPSPSGGPFTVIGFSFPTIFAGPALGSISPDPGRSMLMGYSYFKPYWGTPEITVTMMLTGIYYFNVYNLLTMQGQSYASNQLTRRFLAQFGTRTVGILPKFLFDGERMQDCHLSCLTRFALETYTEKVLAECSIAPAP